MPTSSSRVEWLHVGQEMLRTTGAASIKLVPLVEASGKTSGSFYHHYASIQAFLEDLARTYGTANANSLIDAATTDAPQARLERLHRALQGPRFRPLDVAMRDWAGTFAPAARAVQEFDSAVFAFLQSAFLDLGFSRPQARARALLLFGASVARLNPPWKASDRGIVAVLTDPA